LLHYFAAERGWSYPITLSHTWAQLAAEVRADRVDRGEPEDGATASEREARQWLRRIKRNAG
jgi:hypothetical protein